MIGNASEHRARSGAGKPASHNRSVSGSGRLRRPPSQPAWWEWSLGREGAVSKRSVHGHNGIWAGSETAETL